MQKITATNESDMLEVETVKKSGRDTIAITLAVDGKKFGELLFWTSDVPTKSQPKLNWYNKSGELEIIV